MSLSAVKTAIVCANGYVAVTALMTPKNIIVNLPNFTQKYSMKTRGGGGKQYLEHQILKKLRTVELETFSIFVVLPM